MGICALVEYFGYFVELTPTSLRYAQSQTVESDLYLRLRLASLFMLC